MAGGRVAASGLGLGLALAHSLRQTRVGPESDSVRSVTLDMALGAATAAGTRLGGAGARHGARDPWQQGQGGQTTGRYRPLRTALLAAALPEYETRSKHRGGEGPLTRPSMETKVPSGARRTGRSSQTTPPVGGMPP